MMETYVMTSDKHLWLLKGFAHQWNKYGGGAATIAGFTKPTFNLPENFSFISLGNFSDYPMSRWSNALRILLENTDSTHVLLMLEDYWLMRWVNRVGLRIAREIAESDKNILRVDVSSDRLYCERWEDNPVTDVVSLHDIDVFEVRNTEPYSVSLQAGIWNVARLLEIIRDNESAWELELNGTKRIANSNLRILGIRQVPLRYMITVNKGVFDRTGNWMFPPRTLSKLDWAELDDLRYTNREV